MDIVVPSTHLMCQRWDTAAQQDTTLITSPCVQGFSKPAAVEDDADEVVLETEITNKPALKLYENLGFVRDKRLFRYYLNGVDASRLKLWLR